MVNKNQIFICDDEISILEVLSVILEGTGMDIQTEADSSKLIGRLEVSAPALLIIDLWMPIITGKEIIMHLKSNKEFEGIYILCISASMDGEFVSREAGADAFLAKPFDIDAIINIVNQIRTNS